MWQTELKQWEKHMINESTFEHWISFLRNEWKHKKLITNGNFGTNKSEPNEEKNQHLNGNVGN